MAPVIGAPHSHGCQAVEAQLWVPGLPSAQPHERTLPSTHSPVTGAPQPMHSPSTPPWQACDPMIPFGQLQGNSIPSEHCPTPLLFAPAIPPEPPAPPGPTIVGAPPPPVIELLPPVELPSPVAPVPPELDEPPPLPPAALCGDWLPPGEYKGALSLLPQPAARRDSTRGRLHRGQIMLIQS